MKDRRVDPIHFFDQRGNAVVNVEHILRENRALRARNEQLTKLLKRQAERQDPPQAEVSPLIH